MKAERVVLSFIAIIVGLIAAGGAFYFYQMTKTVPSDKAKPLSVEKQTNPTPTPDKGNILTIDSPKDEEIFSNKIVTINGKTDKDATIVVTSEEADQIVKPTANGTFTLSQNIPEGTTILYFTAIFPNGAQKTIERTVTYSTESF